MVANVKLLSESDIFENAIAALRSGNFTLPYASSTVADRAALAALHNPTGACSIYNEVGREGVFIFRNGDFTSSVAADVNQGIYIPSSVTPVNQGCWVRLINGAARASWFGIIPGSSNPAAAIENALSLVETLILSDGDYVLERPLNPIMGINRTLKGDSWSVRLVNSNDSVINLGSGNNFTLDTLTIHNTGTANYGQIVCFHVDIYNLKIHNIQFTNTGALTGQNIKLVCDNAVVGLFGYEISNCLFNGGGMNLEIQNHNATIGYRYRDGVIKNNNFKNAGSVLTSNGMGVSLSGYGLNAQIKDNIFDHASICGIELVGIQDAQITGNLFRNMGTATLINATNAILMGGCIIDNNSTEGHTGSGMLLYSLVLAVVSNNNLSMDGSIVCKGDRNLFYGNRFSSSTPGVMAFDSAIDCDVFGNHLDTVAGACVNIFNASSRNSVHHNSLANGDANADVNNSVYWAVDSVGGNACYANTRYAVASSTRDIEPADYVAPVPTTLTSLAAMVPQQGHVKFKSFTGSSGFTIECQATTGGQPYGMIEINYYGRLNNSPLNGKLIFGFGSYDQPTTNAQITVLGPLPTIMQTVKNGKLNISVDVGATGGYLLEGEASTPISSAISQFKIGSTPSL